MPNIEKMENSGADMVISIGEKIVGEAQAIHWEEDFFADDDYTVKGYIDFVIFDSEVPAYEHAKQKTKFNISITYENEYGNKASTRIYEVLLTKRTNTNSIDDIVQTQRYFYKAKKVEQLNEQQMKEQIVLK